MNTATLSRGHAKSGRPGSGRWRRQPITWRARSSERNATSVVKFPRPLMARMIRERAADGFTILGMSQAFSAVDMPGTIQPTSARLQRLVARP